MMSFDRSTQSKSWVFTEKNLRRCREKATNERLVSRNQNGEVRVRNFASGFRSSGAFSIQNPLPVQLENKEIQSNLLLSSQEQDTLVRFHANQISMLVGPDAILSTLVRSETVYATSIMIFRRFFLSNSVLDFSPRKMATASCFLASKLEESRLDIRSLSNATAVIYDKIKNAPMCRRELGFVSVAEIEDGERDLMEGINYEMRFHHPHSAISVLSSKINAFIVDQERVEAAKLSGTSFYHTSSPRNMSESGTNVEEIIENAMMIASNALVFSDAPFLFPPGQIAFATIAMAMRVNDPYSPSKGLIHQTLFAFLRHRFGSKNDDELNNFEDEVSYIIQHLMDSPVMELKLLSLSRPSEELDGIIAEQAERLGRVFHKVSIIHNTAAPLTSDPIGDFRKRKHSIKFEVSLSPPGHPICTEKVARITPTKRRRISIPS